MTVKEAVFSRCSLGQGSGVSGWCRICCELECNLPFCVIGGNVVDVYIRIHSGAFLNFLLANVNNFFSPFSVLSAVPNYFF